MNFKDIENYLKKNYKFVIIICLFLFLIMSNKEDFTTAQALDGIKSTEKKVNDIFYNIDKDWARSKKGLYSQKEIKGKTIRSTEDVIATRNMTATVNVNAKKDLNGNRLCLGGTCITKAHLDILTGKRHFFMANKDKSRFLKQEGNTNSWKAEWKGSWADPMKRLFIYTSKGRSEPNT